MNSRGVGRLWCRNGFIFSRCSSGYGHSSRTRPVETSNVQTRCSTICWAVMWPQRAGVSGRSPSSAPKKNVRRNVSRKEKSSTSKRMVIMRRRGEAAATTLTQSHADQLAHSRLFHGDAVELVRDLHALARVGDEHELRLLLQALEHANEAADVGVVEGRVHLVQDAEGR